MYIQVIFYPDRTAQIEKYSHGQLIQRKTLQKDIQAMTWMAKQGKDWTFAIDGAGRDVALWEGEE